MSHNSAKKLVNNQTMLSQHALQGIKFIKILTAICTKGWPFNKNLNTM